MHGGKGYWNLDNDVSGWTLSEKGERMLLGWGNASYSRGYSVVYMALAQEVLNDYENFEKCERMVLLANSYAGDLAKQEEIYRKALEIQPINIDAWYGLINVYNANENKTENEYFDLAKEMAENLKYFPLPMQHLTNLIKPHLTTIENQYRFTLLQTRILTEGSQTPNNTADNYYVYQPSLTRLEANYLLGKLDKTIATFSFDGDDAGKIVLSSRFDGNGVRWDYSLDGKQTWTEVSFTAEEEHKLQLTPEQIASITSENDIYVHIVGVNYDEENLYQIDIQESTGLPATLYANDLENKLIAAGPVMQWKYREEDEWTFYRDAEPDLTGNKTVIVRMGATGVYLASTTSSTFTFTQDNLPEDRVYIPISHLSIHGVSTEATNNQGAAAFSIDGNANTRYHSAWDGSDTQRYIIVKLDKPFYLSAVEYIPAAGGNGKIYDGTIYGSMDGENWEILSQQRNLTYTNQANTVDQAIANTKAFEIDNPSKVQYVKIVADRTNGNWFAARMFNFFEDTTTQVAGKFSFDGENAGKIILEDGLQNATWKYSLDAGNTWKPANGMEHQLTAEEMSQINENDEIKIRLDSDGSKGTIHIKKGDTPTITPYVNDWENRLIGLSNVDTLEWKLGDETTWKSYADEEPIVLGNKTLLVRRKATGIYTASDSIEYQFTEDNQPATEKYIPIKHLSIHNYSTQSIDSSRPYYAQNVIDGNINTIWHTDFRYSIAGSRAYITIKLDEAKNISALEFAQKKYRDNDPSYIKNAIVYVSKNGNDWIEAGRMQNCVQTQEPQKIQFDESVSGQYVKFEMEGYGIFASASMINLYEDTTVKIVGSFSFDGEDAGKIMLADEFSGSNWQYSLDSGNTWKAGNGNIHSLTDSEIEQINENDKIKIRFNENAEEYTIHIRKMETPTITAYLNDLENRLIGMGDTTGLEWKIEGDTNWTLYSEKEPIVLGDKKLFVRAKARNIFTASESLEYQFTADNQTDTRKYIPISQLSIAGFSAEDKAQSGAAANAIDGNYHTRWLNSAAGTDTEKYIIIKLDTAIYLSAMDYVPHSENGKILTGKILGSMDGENFTEIKTVTGWANNQLTKTVDFDEAVKVRYVKIIGEETSYTSAKRHVGARMFNFYEDTTKKEVVIPTAEIEYDIETLTNRNVVAKLVNPSTDIKVINNNGSDTYTFTENGEFTFEFEDAEGNKGTATAKVDWICKTLPNATFTYDIGEATNQDVTVTVTFDRENVTILNNNGKNTYTFTENGEFTFNFRGPYGNEGTATAKVDWICKTLPNATFTYDINETTNQNVTVTVTFDRENVRITNNDGKNTYTFTENGEFTFEFIGPYGNAGVATAKVDWIDKKKPTANITYDITELTNKNVIATLNSEEEITITNNNGKNTYTFTENGEFTFEFVNKIGNKGTATAKVDWIDKTIPKASISYNIIEATNQDVIATIRFDKENVTVEGGNTHTFTENGEFTFEFVDKAGNAGTAKAKVTWIDKTLPVATITYSTTHLTNQDVTATITFDKENVVVEGGNTHIFTENGQYEFRFVGPAGNAGVAKAEVTWIDKEAPQPIMVYSTINPTNQNVTARITFENKENVTITNNDGKDTYTFIENGEFTFEYMDEAGNKGQVKAIVNWIDKIAPTATIFYDVTKATNGNVIATLENASEEITITNNDGKNAYTFTENGEFTFEFVDKAGNKGTAIASVTWIDRRLPIATITYSTTDLTDQDVVATIHFDKQNVTVEGGNTHTFTENGEYTFEFVDEAGNMGMKTAVVTWIKKDPVNPDIPEGITSEIYKIEGSYIERISPNTNVNQFIQNVQTEQDLVFLDKEGNQLGENDILATGMTLKVGSTLQFTLIVTGDMDGNGKISMTDLARLKLHYIGKEALTGNALKAADVDGNGKVSITDLAQIRLIIIGKIEVKS